MRITYLGTAAAEGFPALFCRCEYCVEARRLGGKNIRTRSQSLINGDLLIDFPQDTYMHFLNNGIEGDKIKYLIVTHGHRDHFYFDDLDCRHGAFAHNMSVPTLKVIGSATTFKGIAKMPPNVELEVISAFETIELDGYKITALPARHMPGGEALNYIIESEDATLLYAHDTGYPYEDTFRFIEEKKIRFDMVSLDCTNVDIPISDEGSHMGFDNISRVLTRLREMGCTDDKTVCCVNHFSHNGNPIHSHLEERAKTVGCSVSYDGFSVEFGRG